MVSLSAGVIAAQQRFSEKFGVPTFNLTGGISTVPRTVKLSNINVGRGKFLGDTRESFINTLKENINTAKSTAGTIGNTQFFTAKGPDRDQFSGDGGKQSGGKTSFEISEVFNEGLGSAGDFLTRNPTLLIGALALVGLMVLKK